jgi:hypothetical protein
MTSRGWRENLNVWNLSLLLLVLVLVSCGTNPQNPNNPNPPNDPYNPFAEFGCLEAPSINVNEPREIFDIELGKPYELQGGAYRLFFDIDTPSKVRATLTGVEAYDTLYVLVADQIDLRRAGSIFHRAGEASNDDGPPLTQVRIESLEPLEVTVSVTLNRYLSDYTQRADEGKRLFCERYRVVIEKIP